jgi:hypothetical protein
MLKSVKSRAEEQFAATQKESLKAVKQKEKAQLERVEKVAKLRALRLAVEAAEKEVAVKAEAAKAAKAAKRRTIYRFFTRVIDAIGPRVWPETSSIFWSCASITLRMSPTSSRPLSSDCGTLRFDRWVPSSYTTLTRKNSLLAAADFLRPIMFTYKLKIKRGFPGGSLPRPSRYVAHDAEHASVEKP